MGIGDIGSFLNSGFEGAKNVLSAATEHARTANLHLGKKGPLGDITNRDAVRDWFAPRTSYGDKEQVLNDQRTSKPIASTRSDVPPDIFTMALRQSTRPGFTTAA